MLQREDVERIPGDATRRRADLLASRQTVWEQDSHARGGYAFFDPAFDPSLRELRDNLEAFSRWHEQIGDPTAADAFLTIPLARLEQISQHLDLRSPAIDSPIFQSA